jgi:hypothetical protein
MSCGIGDPSQGTGGVEVSRRALLSQEGSAIEAAVEIVRGDERSECKPGRAQPSRVVPEPQSFRMQSETFRMGNHLSPESTAAMVFIAESILDSSSV